MKRYLAVALVAGVLVAVMVFPALADDLRPPPWRGLPRTTFQQWEFMDPNPNPMPDLMMNPYGMPQTGIIGHAWMQDWDGRMGVWAFSGDLVTHIPNVPDHPDYTKELWIQLTWEPQGLRGPQVLVDGLPGQLTGSVPVGPAGWLHSTWVVYLPYNPPMENVLIGGDIMVDELVIDTRCVPEPTTLGLLAIGGLCALLRRKAK
jgi:hypothetical protein